MKRKNEPLTAPALSDIRSPADVKAVPAAHIGALCDEIRGFLVEKVTKTGGHLASNLGVVELSVALHRVFDSPRDRILFDVGHQSYVHKLLTGRGEGFDELRRPGGLSGFPSPKESPHDAFVTGHSSTAFSAALGFAEASRIRGDGRHTVCVVGDGAFTGGMVHEAMNNCRPDLALVIVLNENEMSISRNIGKFAAAISRLRVSKGYNRTKRRTRRVLSRIPLVGVGVEKLLTACKKKAKNALFGSNIFEDLGFFYVGPIDGNDEGLVERALEEAKARRGSVIVHIKTKKGKGYAPAEAHPDLYHGVGQTEGERFHTVAGKVLAELAKEDGDVCAITAAMGIGTGLSPFEAAHPDRYFDVGIAEEHAVTFAAGLAAAGMKPYFAVYSTFLQRAYDNVLHDVALQGLPVRLLVDRAALAEGDGPTHHGVFDVAFLSHIPHVTLWAPIAFGSLERMLRDSLTVSSPLAIRYPNAREDEEAVRAFYPDGNFENRLARADYAPSDPPRRVIVTYGRAVSEALRAKRLLAREGVCVSVILLETLAPYAAVAKRVASLLPPDADTVFLEEGIREGGAGMLLGDALAEIGARPARYRILALSDFVSGKKGEGMLATAGISAEDVARAFRA